MSKESIEAWKICRGITAETFETLIKGYEDPTVQKVCRYVVLSITDLVSALSQFAGRGLIIRVLGTFVERLKIEDEVQEKFGPPPTPREVIEDMVASGRPPDDTDGDGGDDPPASRLM